MVISGPMPYRASACGLCTLDVERTTDVVAGYWCRHGTALRRLLRTARTQQLPPAVVVGDGVFSRTARLVRDGNGRFASSLARASEPAGNMGFRRPRARSVRELRTYGKHDKEGGRVRDRGQVDCPNRPVHRHTGGL